MFSTRMPQMTPVINLRFGFKSGACAKKSSNGTRSSNTCCKPASSYPVNQVITHAIHLLYALFSQPLSHNADKHLRMPYHKFYVLPRMSLLCLYLFLLYPFF